MKKLFYIFIFISSLSFSQTAILDTNTILIGDQIELNISVEFDLNEAYNWPEFTDSVYKKVEIINKASLQEDTTENSKIISQKIVLTCFDSGSYYLPPIVFNENRKTEGLILNVSTIAINDSSAMMDITSTKIGTEDDFTKAEIQEKEEEEKKKKFWMRIALIIGILTAMIYSLSPLINKYKKQEMTIVEREIVDPPHIIALKNLQNLKKQTLWQKGKLKKYYSELSLILRSYIENRFDLPALELPTSDIIKNLKQLDSEILSKLEYVLRKSDNIKYAKGLSTEKQNIESMEISVQFINSTKLEEKDEFSK
jgi:hypothetical protein